MSRPLRIAVVHYHLRPGGVTRVIENAARALEGRARFAALCGPNDPTFERRRFPCPVVELPGLGYADPEADDQAPAPLADLMLEAARQALGAEPDVWHIHNHSLGKNASLSAAVCALAERGQRIVLQIHDFAEDGRPANYRYLRQALAEAGGLEAALYPCAPQVRYAALNDRDRGVLADAGAPGDRLHFLPNPVWLEDEEIDAVPAEGPPLILYPTRAIRRKNLGEFLLWAALDRGESRFGVTLAPKNPAARPVYERWVELANELALPVEFECGARSPLPFAAMLKQARALATTSVAEGFGLAFLEPWLAGRPLAGRNLPDITRDFVDEGVSLDSLYSALRVPLEWAGEERFRRAIAEGLSASRKAYGRAVSDDDIDRAAASAVEGGRVDFGRLDEAMQERALRHAAASRECRSEIEPGGLGHDDVSTSAIAANRRCIRERYSLERYGERLMAIYEAAIASEPGPVESLDAAAVLDAFLAPELFCLLRT